MLENAKLYDKDYDSNATRSWGASTVIAGVTYSTGLFWQPLQNKDDPYTEIEESSESVQEGADLFVIKPGKTVQFGICASGDGYKKGTQSLAVTVSTALSEKSSFVAVFKVDNGWWYCCVRNDIILSDGDMLFLKEDDAKEQFMSMMTVPDWGRRIAPADWNIPDTEDLQLEGILSSGVKAKLQKIKALRGPKLYAIIALSAVVSFWILSSFVTDVLLAPKRAPIVIAPVKPKIMKPVKKAPEIKPWEKIKDPEQILSYCYRDVMLFVKIMPPGWEIGGVNCEENGATASWSRNIGRISWIDKALNESKMSFSARSISADGNTLIASTYYKPVLIKSPPVYTEIELKNIVNDLFQSLSQPISLTDTTVVVEPPKENSRFQQNEEKAKEYKTVSFTFSAPQNPLVWQDILTKFSGLVMYTIKYDTITSMWTYEGAIYVI